MSTNFRDIVIAPAFVGAQNLGFGVTFYVSNTTNPAEDQGTPGVGSRTGRSPKSPFASVGAAVTAAVGGRGDMIIVQRGTYTEAVNFNKAGLVVMAAPGYGYPDHVVLAGLTTINASNITFIDMEFFANAAGVSVHVGPVTEAASIAFLRCSFASNGTTEPTYGCRVRGGNNHYFERCRFVDNTRGLALHSGITSFVSGVTVKECEFLENTTLDFGNTGAAGDNGREYAVHNLAYIDNYHMRGQVTPTGIINITDTEGTSSGAMSGNRFANATNASGQITIPAGILYMANATEAGWSTARPA